MTLRELRDDISRRISKNPSDGDIELSYVTIEDIYDNDVITYQTPETQSDDDDDEEWDDDDDDSELEDEEWETDDDDDLI